MDEVDRYINTFDDKIAERLRTVRDAIHHEIPHAEESIAYGMPAYKLQGKPVVYFAGYNYHIGFYATPNGHKAFAKAFAAYKQGKGSVQFPHDQPLPIELIKRVVDYRKRQLTKEEA